jgi:hypothetical protein
MPPDLLSMLPSALKSGIGLLQTGAGLLTKRPKRPTYEIPSAIREATQAAKSQANVTQRPGATQAQARIDQNLSNTVDTVKNVGGSASNVMQGLMNAQAGANNAGMQEQSKNEMFRYQSFQDKVNALMTMGQYEDKAFEFNEADKYREKRDRRDALIGAGISNFVGGADDAGAMSIMKKYGFPRG